MITLTAKAASQFAARVKEFNRGVEDPELNSCLAKFVRISVKGGGCSGFQYVLNLESDKREGDVEESHLICKTVVDPISAMYLEGVTVDFSETDLSGGFIFINPNASAQCGCGKSFRV